jgi:hypothetical protein
MHCMKPNKVFKVFATNVRFSKIMSEVAVNEHRNGSSNTVFTFDPRFSSLKNPIPIAASETY